MAPSSPCKSKVFCLGGGGGVLNPIKKEQMKERDSQGTEKVDLSGCLPVVGGLGWAVDLDILGSIPTRSFPRLLDTRFW